jgi:hypothetical protein
VRVRRRSMPGLEMASRPSDRIRLECEIGTLDSITSTALGAATVRVVRRWRHSLWSPKGSYRLRLGDMRLQKASALGFG